MKPNKSDFMDMDEDWIHTEVLGQKKKKSGSLYNFVVIVIIVFIVFLLVIAFRGMFSREDLTNLENLEKIKKQAEEQAKIVNEEKEEEKKEEIEDLVYIVKSGDTLAAVGAEFDVEWEKIAEKNGLEEPYALEVGQELVIPGVKKAPTEATEEEPADSGATAPASGGSTYTVQEGDSLAGIGYELGIPWENIAKANNLEPPYPLSVGQVLIIPAQ